MTYDRLFVLLLYLKICSIPRVRTVALRRYSTVPGTLYTARTCTRHIHDSFCPSRFHSGQSATAAWSLNPWHAVGAPGAMLMSQNLVSLLLLSVRNWSAPELTAGAILVSHLLLCERQGCRLPLHVLNSKFPFLSRFSFLQNMKHTKTSKETPQHLRTFFVSLHMSKSNLRETSAPFKF